MFLEISVLGRYKDILEISILLNIKKNRIFVCILEFLSKKNWKKKKKIILWTVLKKTVRFSYKVCQNFMLKFVWQECKNIFRDFYFMVKI